jgi:hypothetical protein
VVTVVYAHGVTGEAGVPIRGVAAEELIEDGFGMLAADDVGGRNK